MATEKISKSITVDITVTKHDWKDRYDVEFNFFEPESGDNTRIVPEADLSDIVERVGSEICSWVSLMKDQLNEEGIDSSI